MLKRFLSMLVGILILVAVMALNNILIFNIAVAVVAVMGLYEFYNAMRKISIKPIELLGYISALLLIAIPYVDINTLRLVLVIFLPTALLILFSISVFSNNKRNVADISSTIFGMIYVTYSLAFLVFTRQMTNGVYYIWFTLGSAWITDTFAYLIGMLFGKTIGNHKFSSISPNKSIEGCIGGIFGCIIFFIGYAYYLSNVGIELNYVLMGIIGIVASIISQIGDFAASTIKRYCKIKDFGNIMPGHGGVLDRFDSILLVAPFIYLVFNLLK